MALRLSRHFILAAALTATWAPALRASDKTPASVEVKEAREHGELPYRFYIEGQKYLLARMPLEPRLIDLRLRANYQNKSEAEADAYDTAGWGVSILSDSVDVTVPMQRGGYFLLPELADAYNENGVIMFKDPNQRRHMAATFAVRIPEDQRIAYAALGKAVDEAQGVAGKISFFRQDMRELKHSHFTGIKACFLDHDGDILVDGTPVADGAVGDCKVLTIDPARAAGNDVVEFSKTLNIVTVVDTRRFQR